MHWEICGPELVALWFFCASVSQAMMGDGNPPSQGCVSPGGKKHGWLIRQRVETRPGFEKELSVSTSIGNKKKPATKSPKKNCSQYRAEVRAPWHLTSDLSPNSPHSPGTISHPVLIISY